VFYHLADARSFAGQRVMVVGLGDVAMEAAVALAHQPDTEVTLVHRGDGFRRGKPRNIAEVERLVQSGRIALLFDGELTAIEHDFVALRSRGKQRRIANDVVFVMIGAIAPEKLLAEAGVRIGARA
jgi:thioredoxin reductase